MMVERQSSAKPAGTKITVKAFWLRVRDSKLLVGSGKNEHKQ